MSARKRWGNLLAAIDAGDAARVIAYAAEGDAKRDAWAAVRASEASAPKRTRTTRKSRKAAKAPKACSWSSGQPPGLQLAWIAMGGGR